MVDLFTSLFELLTALAGFALAVLTAIPIVRRHNKRRKRKKKGRKRSQR